MSEQLFESNAQPKIFSRYNSDASIILANDDTKKFTSTLPKGSVNLIITSPPYNVGKEYEVRQSIKEYLRHQKEIIEKLVVALSDNGSICWEVGNYVNKSEVFPLDIYYYEIFKELGMKLRNRIIWHFGHGLHASKRFSGRYETILWFTKEDKYKFNLDAVRIPSKYPGKRSWKGPDKGKPTSNPLGKNPSDIWEIVKQDWEDELWDIPNVKANHPEKTEHPCQFPIELVRRCILALTDKDDVVYDPFCGVGSAIIAALHDNRKGFGCDKETKYIETAKERIKLFYEGKLKIRPLGKPVNVPTGREKVSQIPKEWGKNNSNQGELL